MSSHNPDYAKLGDGKGEFLSAVLIAMLENLV